MTAARVEADLALRADENTRAFCCAWARACATGNVWQSGDILATTTGSQSRAFNQGFAVRRPADPLRAFTELREHFAQRRLRARVRMLEQLDIDESVLAAAGLAREGGIPSLALQPIDIAAAPGDFDIRPVRDEATLTQHVATVATSFEFPPEDLAPVFTPRLLDNPAWHGYTAYAGPEPIASSQLYVHGGVAGIYYVGTLEAHRGRGLGEAMTRRAVLDGAAAGCDIATLQASPMGLPIYQRMGFRVVGYYRGYIPQEA